MDEELAAAFAKMLQADGLPGVLVSNRPWRELSADAIAHLVSTRTPIYVRHGQLVRIQRKEDDTPCIEALTETTLKGMLARTMNFVKVTVKGHMHCPPPDAMVKDIPTLGKSLLAETVALIATGRKASMMTAPYDDNEWRKRIASTLAEGATIITIDNIKARLQSASLDSALTSHTVKERILGESRNGVYAQCATWMATGNNIQLGGDLPRRCYWIRMDARTAKPWTRGGFKHDLETWIPAHRGEIIVALLTLVRAWYDAGKSPLSEPIKMGSFQAWVNTIGGILEYGSVSNFLGNAQALQEQDEDALQWAAFLHAWLAHYHRNQILASVLAKDIKVGSTLDEVDSTLVGLYNALPDDLTDIQKGDFKRRLGKALSYRVGTQFDESGLHLVKGEPDKRSGAVYWSVAFPEPGAVSL